MNHLHSLLFFLFSFSWVANAQDHYTFKVDLTKCADDKLTVELLVPAIHTKEIIYRIPKIVPGTYEVYNFGRLVSDFAAFDESGKELDAERLDKNSWKIRDADQLKMISYKVEDSWDETITDKESFIFEPGGSNFEEGKNFVLNTHCVFGYIDGMIRTPYEINIKHPAGFYGACSLTDVTVNGDTDSYHVTDYMQLQDAPMMYCVPDTTVLTVGETEVLISLYSPNKVTSSGFIGKKINEILTAQQAYLGGRLPIKKYAYLIYLTPKTSGSGANGALEHSYSSMYFLPEMEPKYLVQSIKDISAHEFFHIVTPLSIHAEQIGNFDYSNPKMSEHLWLYEGVTEYAASLVQVKYGNMSTNDYLKVIDKKMQRAHGYNDSLPFTVMSSGCLDIYKEQYGNVYQKGALIGLCLDLRLRYLSNGKYGVQEMMQDLSKTYGKDRSFKDEELFDQIVKLTYPEIGDFFKRYVQGSEPLPIKEYMAFAGIEMGGKTTGEKEISFGNVAIGLNEATKRLVIINTDMMDDFGKALGYKEDDELVKFNGKKINLENAQQLIGTYHKTAKEGDVLKIVVARKQLNTGKIKKVKLKATVFPTNAPKQQELMLSSSPTPGQLQIRNAWIGKH
jgi:predicted metalloprotease with PDZ domain